MINRTETEPSEVEDISIDDNEEELKAQVVALTREIERLNTELWKHAGAYFLEHQLTNVVMRELSSRKYIVHVRGDSYLIIERNVDGSYREARIPQEVCTAPCIVDYIREQLKNAPLKAPR